ncbi:hypothetical protein JB92DRAFT_2588403, partial [Gautieria morchelliformis]
ISDHQMELLIWLLCMNGAANVPSLSQLKTSQGRLQAPCGIRSTKYTGSLGHTYYINNIGEILAQEMANPQVREGLCFFPEDARPSMQVAYHGRRWLHEMHPFLRTPMIWCAGDDYFI